MASFLKWTAVFLVAMNAGAFAAPHFEDDLNKGWKEAVDAMDSKLRQAGEGVLPEDGPSRTAPAARATRSACLIDRSSATYPQSPANLRVAFQSLRHSHLQPTR